MNLSKKIIICALLCALLSPYSFQAFASDFYSNEAAWIMSTQKETGALGLTPNQSSDIIPYYSNLTLYNLVKNGLAEKKEVKDYIIWYLDHVNYEPDNLGVTGTIYDYDIVDGEEIPIFIIDPAKKSYDSSDSYAGTFLSLVYAYYQEFGDKAFLKKNIQKLKTVAGAIDATLQSNGLTYAKIDYHTSYLMDNVEVWHGYYSFAALLKSLGDKKGYYKYHQRAKTVQNAIEDLLWDEEEQEYSAYLGHNTDWTKFYPDASANMWPIIFGLPEAKSRTEMLYAKFISNNKAWLTLDGFDSPKASMAVAAALAGDKNGLDTYSQTVETKYPTRAWPWKVSESGWYIMAKKILDGNNSFGLSKI